MARKKAALVQPETPQKPLKIAILGTASSSVMDAPYDDESWQIWNISANFNKGKRFDNWFELHSPEVLDAARTHPDYFDFLKKCGNKLIAGHKSDRWPEAHLYPLDRICGRFGDYFTSSLAYMIAMALDMHLTAIENGQIGVAEIGLWGVDMATSGEYASQRPCCEYYLGIARGMGIVLKIAPESPLLRTPAKYAFDYLKLSREMTQRELDARVESEQLRIRSLNVEKEYEFARGVHHALKQVNQYWNL